MRLFINSRLGEVLKRGRGVIFPEFFERVDLVWRYLSGSELLLRRRHTHDPLEQCSVADERAPLLRVPVMHTTSGIMISPTIDYLDSYE